MAKHLDIMVIAEGVETATQAEILKKIGCHGLQGFFYAKPLPKPEFEAFIRSVENDGKT
jgi:EAL domain-containing protein (putative c-di-GMP-specific phosphodiesterase class I)